MGKLGKFGPRGSHGPRVVVRSVFVPKARAQDPVLIFLWFIKRILIELLR
jgi:hypothetical protein